MSESAVETDSDLAALEQYLGVAEASLDGDATAGEIIDKAKSLRGEAEDKTSDGGVSDDGAASAPEPPPPPRVRTPEEQAEVHEAAARLERFDPDDEGQIREWLDDPRYAQSFSEEQRTELELRLAEMGERGEYAAQLDSQLLQFVDSAADEMRLLDDEINKARTLRDRRELENKYLEISRLQPKVKTELHRREADRQVEVSHRARAEMEATEQIVEARRAKLRQATGQLSAEEMLAGKEAPRKQSPAAIDAARWELEQPLDRDEVERSASRLYEQNKANSRKKQAVKYREYVAKDDASAWSRSFEFFFPGGGQ